ncbi:MAG: response regulator [Desulfovibrio sp.]|nr:response regulator [Desulfovibrio sp.]MBI4958989.1 response regulator [Desulfovibrio sp.]
MATAATASFTVILANRNRHIRELLAREFSREGISVKSCGLGREATNLAASGADILVVDSELPDMDPLSVIRQARLARPVLPVAVHAHEIEEASACLTEPMVFFVPKSEDPSILVEAVRGMLEQGIAGSPDGRNPEQRQG